MNSPRPSRALLRTLLTTPPTMKVGSRPARANTAATKLVVVVLPCVPATAMARRKRINSPSICARGSSGMLAARAAASSGLASPTALEATTTSAAAMFSARWPISMRAPAARRRASCALSEASEPDTWKPNSSSTSAMPLMPMPPMPTK